MSPPLIDVSATVVGLLSAVLCFASAGGPWLVLSVQGKTFLEGNLQTGAVPAFLGALAGLVLAGVLCFCSSLCSMLTAFSCCSSQHDSAFNQRLRNASVVMSSFALIGATAGLFLPLYNSITIVSGSVSAASALGVALNVSQPGLALAATGLALTFVLHMLCFFGRIAGAVVEEEGGEKERAVDSYHPRNGMGRRQNQDWEQDRQQYQQQQQQQQRNLPHQQYSSSATRSTRSPMGRSLPPGWQVRQTPLGEVYYDNINTGVTQWDRPVYN